MSQITNRALADSLLELLESRPLDKISVKDITDNCGLTRNAFYYHFHDVYELIEWIFNTEQEKYSSRYEEKQDWEKGFQAIFAYLYQHRNVIRNVYRSTSFDIMYRFVAHIVYLHIYQRVSSEFSMKGIREGTIKATAEFYTNALNGTVYGWIKSGMERSPDSVALHVETIYEGSVDAVVSGIEEGVPDPVLIWS